MFAYHSVMRSDANNMSLCIQSVYELGDMVLTYGAPNENCEKLHVFVDSDFQIGAFQGERIIFFRYSAICKKSISAFN